MGLFGKKPEPKPQEPAKTTPDIQREVENICINVPEKGVRVELYESTASVRYATIKQAEDKILIVSSGNIIIAEISKRTKCYSEIEPKVGHSCENVTIEAKEGDYGPYYRVKLKFADTVIIKS